MLNLRACLFRHGEQSAISAIINECVETVAIEKWLGVLRQLLSRIHIKSPSIRSLLVRLGEKHPQALIYQLSVLLNSPVAERKAAAEALMNTLRSHSSALVEEALMASSERLRVAILRLKTWHEGLEASRLYFGEGNVTGMLDLLLPLHDRVMRLFSLVNALLERGRPTKKHDLRIQRYATSPLSYNCGLVVWVPHSFLTN